MVSVGWTSSTLTAVNLQLRIQISPLVPVGWHGRVGDHIDRGYIVRTNNERISRPATAACTYLTGVTRALTWDYNIQHIILLVQKICKRHFFWTIYNSNCKQSSTCMQCVEHTTKLLHLLTCMARAHTDHRPPNHPIFSCVWSQTHRHTAAFERGKKWTLRTDDADAAATVRVYCNGTSRVCDERFLIGVRFNGG